MEGLEAAGADPFPADLEQALLRIPVPSSRRRWHGRHACPHPPGGS